MKELSLSPLWQVRQFPQSYRMLSDRRIMRTHLTLKMRILCCTTVALLLAATVLGGNLGDLPMQNPDLFGGDMLGIKFEDRNVIPDLKLRWTGKTVPFIIDPAINHYSGLIAKAMADYHRNTCIRFVPRTHEVNHIRIFSGQGCYSNVGMIGGQQPVSLGQGCMFVGTIVHELGHALGFFHEQNRSDRDQHLVIYWRNIQRGMDTQFFALKPHENLLLDPFDRDSVMLYGGTAFSRDGRSPTMAARDGRPLLDTFDKPGLSRSDIVRLRKMYSC